LVYYVYFISLKIIYAGEVIVRQQGMKFRPGTNVYAGKDSTLHAQVDGRVEFSQTRLTKFNGKKEKVTLVHVAA